MSHTKLFYNRDNNKNKFMTTEAHKWSKENRIKIKNKSGFAKTTNICVKFQQNLVAGKWLKTSKLSMKLYPTYL